MFLESLSGGLSLMTWKRGPNTNRSDPHLHQNGLFGAFCFAVRHIFVFNSLLCFCSSSSPPRWRWLWWCGFAHCWKSAVAPCQIMQSNYDHCLCFCCFFLLHCWSSSPAPKWQSWKIAVVPCQINTMLSNYDHCLSPSCSIII